MFMHTQNDIHDALHQGGSGKLVHFSLLGLFLFALSREICILLIPKCD